MKTFEYDNKKQPSFKLSSLETKSGLCGFLSCFCDVMGALTPVLVKFSCTVRKVLGDENDNQVKPLHVSCSLCSNLCTTPMCSMLPLRPVFQSVYCHSD